VRYVFRNFWSLHSGITVINHQCYLAGVIWNFWRANRKYDKTAKERQAFLYDILMISIMVIPVLSFAFMAILLMFKA